MKWKASQGSAWDVAKRLGGALAFCLLAMMAADPFDKRGYIKSTVH